MFLNAVSRLHASITVDNTSVVEVPGMAGINFTTAGSLKKAASVKALLDGGHVKLFTDDLVPTAATTKTEFTAAEADFKGYAAIVNAFSDPITEAGGGASIRQFDQFDFDSGAVGGSASNRIAGLWVEDTDDDLWFYMMLPEVITVEGDGTGVPVLLIITEGVSG